MTELIVLDVDGCLTDGKIIYTENGDEIKAFDVKDGLAIASWLRLGKKVAVITGRESKIVQRRAEELGITHIFQGVKDKRRKLLEILETEGLGFENISVIGDDLNDYHMLKPAGKSFCPRNAITVIRESVDTVLEKNGGDGAVREMIEIIVEQEGLKEEFLKLWL